MTQTELTAESFVTLLRALPKKQQNAVVVRIARDREFAEDILDLALIAERRKGPSVPFRQYLAQRRKR